MIYLNGNKNDEMLVGMSVFHPSVCHMQLLYQYEYLLFAAMIKVLI